MHIVWQRNFEVAIFVRVDPDAIAAKVQALRDVGVEYLLVNSAGGIRSLRRFAQEIMPAFSGTPVLDAVD